MPARSRPETKSAMIVTPITAPRRRCPIRKYPEPGINQVTSATSGGGAENFETDSDIGIGNIALRARGSIEAHSPEVQLSHQLGHVRIVRMLARILFELM